MTPGPGSAVVVAGGPPTANPHEADLLATVPVGPVVAVIAADSGLDHALALGLEPTALVGDLDSVSESGLAWATRHGLDVHRYPADKDKTDTALAMDLASGTASRVLVVASAGGRLDHALATLLLLAADCYAAVEITAVVDGAVVSVVRSERLIEGTVGSLVSLLAVGGPASGVTVEGLRWPLEDAVLLPGDSLGVSNEMTGTQATVSVATGVVLVIQSRE